jgi:tripartite-type tricarboxylate transporter receptor subunit TctC
MHKRHFVSFFVIGLSVALAAGRDNARADSVSDFYKGRTIYALVGLAPGGGADLNMRLVARHLGRFIPGQPNIVPPNMVGAAGMTMANYVSKVASRDGSVVALFQNSLPGRQAVGLSGVQYDANKLQWLGSAAPAAVEILIVSKNENVTSVEQLREKEIAVGSNGPGGISSSYPRLLNDFVGTKLKVVEGYTGSSSVDLAIERGEVGGRNYTFSGLQTNKPDWLKSGAVKVLVYAGERPAGMPENVPQLSSFLNGKTENAIASIVLAGSQLGFPFAVHPEVPQDRVAALRKAFATMLQDPDFLADAERSRMEPGFIPAEKVTEIIASLFAQTPEDLQRAKHYFQ